MSRDWIGMYTRQHPHTQRQRSLYGTRADAFLWMVAAWQESALRSMDMRPEPMPVPAEPARNPPHPTVIPVILLALVAVALGRWLRRATTHRMLSAEEDAKSVEPML
jgi:hypothetical protein